MRFIPLLFLAMATPAKADVFLFETPSGNIGCEVDTFVDGVAVNCQITQRNGSAIMPRPGSCGASWGHAFAVEQTGPARMVCAPVYGPFQITNPLPYGQTVDLGAVKCSSEKTGLTCRNDEGHGFFLSRRQQRIF